MHMTTRTERRLLQAGIACILLAAVGMAVSEYARRAMNRAIVGSLVMMAASAPPGTLGGRPISEVERREIYGLVILAAEHAGWTWSFDMAVQGHLPIRPGLGYMLHNAVGRIAMGNHVGRADVLEIVREGAAAGW
jgi:hypothetical protein